MGPSLMKSRDWVPRQSPKISHLASITSCWSGSTTFPYPDTAANSSGVCSSLSFALTFAPAQEYPARPISFIPYIAWYVKYIVLSSFASWAFVSYFKSKEAAALSPFPPDMWGREQRVLICPMYPADLFTSTTVLYKIHSRPGAPIENNIIDRHMTLCPYSHQSCRLHGN